MFRRSVGSYTAFLAVLQEVGIVVEELAVIVVVGSDLDGTDLDRLPYDAVARQVGGDSLESIVVAVVARRDLGTEYEGVELGLFTQLFVCVASRTKARDGVRTGSDAGVHQLAVDSIFRRRIARDTVCRVADVIPFICIGEEATAHAEFQRVHSQGAGGSAVPVVRDAVALNVVVELQTPVVKCLCVEAIVGLLELVDTLAERGAALEIDNVGRQRRVAIDEHLVVVAGIGFGVAAVGHSGIAVGERCRAAGGRIVGRVVEEDTVGIVVVDHTVARLASGDTCY